MFPEHWDIFCVVVDNYGDIGVTWRLAQQLVAEYAIEVNLWVDDLKSFSHILPLLNPLHNQQQFNGVNIIHWNNEAEMGFVAGSVLIEAFACELPSSVISALTQLKHTHPSRLPVWLNLEYLSAEDWVEGCHGLPSTQLSGLHKHFYFPGFTVKTGGLICEQDLFARRDSWQSDSGNKQALFEKLGLSGIEAHHTVISVFSYETDALPALIQYWQTSPTPIHLLVPKGRSLNSISALLPCSVNELATGQQILLDSVTLHILPMTDQQGYDQLLWSCDFNIVRGEDSFLRAQWAAKPFIWHIYPQEDDYHLIKLQAFMQVYCDNLAPDLAKPWCELNLSFNQGDQIDTVNHWQKLEFNHLPLLQHAKNWPMTALSDADLATRLVQFVKSR
ncbi:elongation factor P maturation arginine rhamnosyltransferase EarP [Shewanella sp. OMA3-2]|uniref:elongation factor P maturation arginine rhamnosyltransferase EarP n=1 Tax=Shewanella sp. OMA3-2 TaxID=2908650 RepID=UPI001F4487C2|nr:elongation factor P maturation arginine rhamnosyltransferase EarP [Shewanella sp. OMA3-2]UJF23542.1 elongation factor P maturation arginine rhamnosyltransferase EarP [Shewanella sp. OMA3-2]